MDVVVVCGVVVLREDWVVMGGVWVVIGNVVKVVVVVGWIVVGWIVVVTGLRVVVGEGD
jgi:hypothetical protein